MVEVVSLLGANLPKSLAIWQPAVVVPKRMVPKISDKTGHKISDKTGPKQLQQTVLIVKKVLPQQGT